MFGKIFTLAIGEAHLKKEEVFMTGGNCMAGTGILIRI
jgi:hypothetical protein